MSVLGYNVETVKRQARELASAGGLACTWLKPGSTPAATPTSVSFTGTRTMLSAERLLCDAGLSSNYSFSVLADALQFTGATPAEKQRVIIGGTTYAIARVDTDALGACLRLHLSSEYERR